VERGIGQKKKAKDREEDIRLNVDKKEQNQGVLESGALSDRRGIELSRREKMGRKKEREGEEEKKDWGEACHRAKPPASEGKGAWRGALHYGKGRNNRERKRKIKRRHKETKMDQTQNLF